MKKHTLKQLTIAHGWLGLIISGALMIVFLCGTISFFKADIHAWEQYYQPKAHQNDAILSPGQISKIIADKAYDIPIDHRMLIILPNEDVPQYQAYFATEAVGGKHQRHSLFFDPVTGEQLENKSRRFYLADFLYKLHIDLNIPAGQQIVGIVSLLFLVIVISGILIHLKKLIKYFYQYRTNRTKDTYLDGHNLIGVTSLPYTFMYALTGVMFNLSIIFQAGFGYLVFQGDIERLSQTSGFTAPNDIASSNSPTPWQNIDKAIEHANQQLTGAKVHVVKIWGFGDENAQMELRLVNTNAVIERVTLTYPLNDYMNFKQTDVLDNSVQGTYHVLKQLHYGNFGGVTLQFIYFFLGLGCCYLILSGNLIWLEKRVASNKTSPKMLNGISAMTICLSLGSLLAVAISFNATRFLSDVISGADLLPYLFSFALALSFFHAFFMKSRCRITMIQQALTAAALFALTPIYDLVYLLINGANELTINNTLMVNILLILVSAFCLVFAYSKQTKSSHLPETSLEVATDN